MPTPREGETQSDFISRCIPFVINEGTTDDPKQAAAICHSLWRKHKNSKNEEDKMQKKDGKVMKHLSANFVTTDKGNIKNLKATTEDKHPMVLVVGNRFMNGEFVPADELEKVYKQWDGTYHNLNHGRNFDGRVMIQEIVGVHTNSQFKDNSVIVDIIEGEKTEGYDAWKGFLALNQKAGKPTNVSMETYASEKTVKYSEIKKLVSKDDRYVARMQPGDDDEVTVLVDLEPAGGATVDIGAGGDECSYMNKDVQVTKNETVSLTASSTGWENTASYIPYVTTTVTEPYTVTIQTSPVEIFETVKEEKIVEDKKTNVIVEEKKETMVEETKPVEQPKTEQEKPKENEEIIALKKQIEMLTKQVTDMQTKPVTSISDKQDDEWVGLTALKQIKNKLKTTKREI